MERKGLVKRAKDLEKKNLVRIALTEKGQRVYAQSTKRESIHQIMSFMSEEKCEQMSECLGELRDKALEYLGDVPKPPRFHSHSCVLLLRRT
jgi:DNA-binding MarR family transcriptional regulator